MDINSVVRKIKKNSPRADVKKIREAYLFAETRHRGQKRMSGEDYIVHPLFVIDFLSKFNFNTPTYQAALLHDVVEDTETGFKKIRTEFGEEVETLVRGVTKLKKIKGKLITKESLKDYSIENLQKMFLAMGADVRVILIKLADRLHNMKTLEHLESKDRKRIAQETIEIYAPLANRLGMGEVKGQLEDFSFPFLYPKAFEEIKDLYFKEIDKRKGYVNKARRQLLKYLKDNDIKVANIHGRTKHLFSLYRKLKRYDNNINKIYDLIAIRVIVENIPDCYKALGLIHQKWKPLIGRIKDYISVPKTNGYQSIHTTVLTSDGEIVEIQIRTQQMHEEAEYGIAAHWHYSESGKPKTGLEAPTSKVSWIQQLVKWQKEVSNDASSKEKYLESLKIDIFEDRIFAFTPQGSIIDLPEGATPIDFAYEIHTDLGNHCGGARVNSRIATLDYKIENGDRVEIIKDKSITPNRDWLQFVKTNLAKNQIKNWFKKLDQEKNIELGKQYLNEKLMELKGKKIDKVPKIRIFALLQKLNIKKLDDLFVGISQGDIEPTNIIEKLYSEQQFIKPVKQKSSLPIFGKPKKKLIAKIEGESGFLTNVAKCCNPGMDDEIKAHITRSKGASIHKYDCDELQKFTDGSVVNAVWDTPYKGTAKITVETLNRVGMLRDLTALITDFNINIKEVRSIENTKRDMVNVYLTVEIKKLDQLLNLIQKIKSIEGVVDVKRK